MDTLELEYEDEVWRAPSCDACGTLLAVSAAELAKAALDATWLCSSCEAR